jgi:hypothetical protein
LDSSSKLPLIKMMPTMVREIERSQAYGEAPDSRAKITEARPLLN